MTHRLNSRVKRRIDVYNENSPYKYGTIIKCYNRPAKEYPSGYTLGPYPELYDVKWDNGEIHEGYLPHGIISISQS